MGDEILSRDEYDPEAPVRTSTVEAVFKLEGTIIELVVGGRLIETTDKHPFYVDGAGWVAARELQPGQMLLGEDGSLTQVDSVTTTERSVTVYNLRVAGDHTYFVGGDDWGFSVWVHNSYSVRLNNTTGKWEVFNTRTNRTINHVGAHDTEELALRRIEALEKKLKNTRNANELRNNMGMVFESGDQAHHIVASGHRKAEEARDILERHGIGINEAVNGVALPKKRHHGRGLHSFKGIEEVTTRLRAAEDFAEDNGLDVAGTLRRELQKLAAEMKSGAFSKSIGY